MRWMDILRVFFFSAVVACCVVSVVCCCVIFCGSWFPLIKTVNVEIANGRCSLLYFIL